MPTVDYRLARRATLRAVRRGMLARPDVCDAHPELIRAARFIGDEIDEPCPICETENLRIVLYGYGKEMRRESGRVVRRADLPALRARFGEFVCYAVEVCMGCQWNHLVRSFTTGYKNAV